jgi:hypothetical protein
MEINKKDLVFTLQPIRLFIEGNRSAKELKEWSMKLQSLAPDEYDELLEIIKQYNHIVNKNRDKYGKIGDDTIFNIKSWVFDKEQIKEIQESMDIQELFMGDLSEEEVEKHKHKLPKISVSELMEQDDRDWKPGEVALLGDEHYLVVEGKDYEKYCDFGCGYIATYLAENPDINEDEFGEYVCTHNKADRDMGELQDVCKEEIERLGKEFKSKIVKESKDDDFYHSTLDDDYWKEICEKFPNYNNPDDPDCDKAVDYIFTEMKKKYPDEDISEDIKKEIHGGIT